MSETLQFEAAGERAGATTISETSQTGRPALRGRAGRRLARIGLRLLPFVLVLGIWEAISALGLVDPLVVPGPAKVASAFRDGLFVDGSMWLDTWATFYRALTGLVLGSALGLVVGMLMGQWRWLAHLIEPLISFAFPMPKLALLPLLIVIFGIGQTSLLVMVTLGAFFPMVVNTFAGVTGVSRVLLWNAHTLGANRFQRLRTVVVFAALPHVLSGLRIAGGVSFLLVVAAEMISANTGLGYLIIFSQRNYRPDIVIAGILTTAALGFVIDRLISRMSHALLRWQDTSTD